MEIKNVMSDDFSVQKELTHPKTRSNFEKFELHKSLGYSERYSANSIRKSRDHVNHVKLLNGE